MGDWLLEVYPKLQGYSKRIALPQCGVQAFPRKRVPSQRDWFGYSAAQSRMTFPDFPEFMISKPSR